MLDSNNIDKWTLRQSDVISLVMDLTCMATGFGMTKIRKLSEVEMLLLINTCSIRTRLQNLQMQINKSEQVSLEEISESDAVNRRQNTEVKPESEPETEFGSELEQIVESITPDLPTKRSSRTIVAPQRYSPSLHYLLLTNAGEPEHFAKAM